MKKLRKPGNEAHLNGNGATTSVKLVDEPTTQKAKNSKAKVAAKTRKGAHSKSGAENGKLVCRYCGGDDLAPSFIKRRDARCRACFQQRYGAAATTKRAAGARL